MKIEDKIKPFVQDGTYQIQYPIYRVMNWLKGISLDTDMLELELDPDFQRPLVWDNERCSQFIEYIARGGKSGNILYFNCPNWMVFDKKAKFQIVDGKQRIEAIRKFLDNEITIFGGVYFKDIEDVNNLGSVYLHVNTLKTKHEVLNWYLGINAGGVPHSQQEIERVQNMLLDKNETLYVKK